MGMWTAASGDDYRDAQEYFGSTVEMTCADCGEPFDVLFADGPPMGRPLCDACRQEAATAVEVNTTIYQGRK